MRGWRVKVVRGGLVLWGLMAGLFLFHSWSLIGTDPISRGDGLSVVWAQEKTAGGSLTKLKADPLYKAVKLSWTATIQGSGAVTFEIHRSQAKPDGPYTLVTSIEGKAGVQKYEYLDKNLPVEENYFYRIEIPATKESFGPVQVRPPFSLPTT